MPYDAYYDKIIGRVGGGDGDDTRDRGYDPAQGTSTEGDICRCVYLRCPVQSVL